MVPHCERVFYVEHCLLGRLSKIRPPLYVPRGTFVSCHGAAHLLRPEAGSRVRRGGAGAVSSLVGIGGEWISNSASPRRQC